MQKLVVCKKGSSGYTLLEVLVVVAILGTVLIPVSVFFQEYINRISSEDLLINHQLAKSEMERALATKHFTDRDTTMIVDSKSFALTIVCEKNGDLLEVTVTSKRSKVDGKPIVLSRYVYLKENN